MDTGQIVATAALSSAVGAIVGGAINFLVFGALRELKRKVERFESEDERRRADAEQAVEVRLSAAAKSRKEMHERMVTKNSCSLAQERMEQERRDLWQGINTLRTDIGAVDRQTAHNTSLLELIAKNLKIDLKGG